MWNPFARTVQVHFLAGETDSLIACSDVPVKQLPDTFAPNTTVHLRGEEWLVVKASPLVKAEFAKSRQLRLWVQRARQTQLVNPSDLLFSLPTISNELPACDGPAVDGTELELHEDDWRQVEWIVDGPNVQNELDSIVSIFQNSRVGVGFRQVHVRKLVPQPLRQVSLHLSSVIAWLGSHDSRDQGIRIRGGAQRVRGGFAFQIPVGWVYGLASPERVVQVLALQPADLSAPPSSMPAPPHPSIILVDWCRAHRVV